MLFRRSVDMQLETTTLEFFSADLCVSFQYSVNDDSQSFESILILCALWQGALIVIRNIPSLSASP